MSTPNTNTVSETAALDSATQSTNVTPENEVTIDAETTDITDVNVESVEAKIAELTSQLAKQNEIVEKARKGEKYQKNLRDAEVKKVQTLYEAEKARADALENKFKVQASDAVLRQLLNESGAKAVDTALKLVDRSAIKFAEDGSVDVDSIKEIVSQLRTSDSVLFDMTTPEPVTAPKTTTPPAVRATESDSVMGFNAEIKAAKTQAELQAVLKKYGK